MKPLNESKLNKIKSDLLNASTLGNKGSDQSDFDSVQS